MAFNDENKIISLEDRLKGFGNTDSNYTQLLNIYNINKPMIVNSLDRITDYYFQYSEHGESHSKNIITSIEKVLGNNGLDLLSPTDVFILLLSAYLHDFAMSLRYDDIIKVVNSEDFKKFICEQEENRDFDEDIKIVKETTYNKDNISLLVQSDVSLRRLIAEYHRRSHAKNSEDIILSLFKNYEININPNKTLPDRIIKIIGEVCSFHGESIENIDKFEICENGIDNEDIHPKFLAILIRIGDLLDLDSNRYNEQLLNNKRKLNKDSQIHYDKHKSITHFYTSPAKIIIKAECESEEVLRAMYNWCEWLKNELYYLRNNISDIIPDNWNIRVPSLNTEINRKGVKGEYSNNNLSINMKREQAFEIITGSTIYNDKFAFLREYLQNALDASKTRLWEEIIDLYDFTDDHHKDNIDIHIKLINGRYDSLLEKFKITFDIFDSTILKKDSNEYINSRNNLSNLYESDDNCEILKAFDNGQLIIVVQDNGTGIAEDIIYNKILSPGINYKTKQINSEYRTPKLLQSTGAFGIGIHSAFMVTDKVYFKTKCVGDTYFKDLIIYSSKNLGWVEYIERSNAKEYPLTKSGTKCFIALNQDELITELDYKNTKNYNENYGVKISQILYNLDQWYICDLFNLKTKLNENITISKYNNEYDGQYDSQYYNQFDKSKRYSCHINFDEKNEVYLDLLDLKEGHRLNLVIYPYQQKHYKTRIITAFKGIKFDFKNEDFDLEKFIFAGTFASIDYGFNNTIEYLKINRDSLTPKAIHELPLIFRDMVKLAIKYIVTYMFNNNIEKTVIKTIYLYYLNYVVYEDLEPEIVEFINSQSQEFYANELDVGITKVKENSIKFQGNEELLCVKSVNYNNILYIYPISYFETNVIFNKSNSALFYIKFTSKEDFVKINFDDKNIENLIYFLHAFRNPKDKTYNVICFNPIEKYSSLCISLKSVRHIELEKYKFQYYSLKSNQGGFIPLLFNRLNVDENFIKEQIIEYIKLLAYSRKISTMEDKKEIAQDVLKLIDDMYRVENDDINQSTNLDFENDIYTDEFQETLENLELHQYEE